MAKITREIVKELNTALEATGSGIRFDFGGEDTIAPKIMITIADPVGFLHPELRSVVNCSNKFFDWLDNWFLTNYNIKLTYNNTKEIAWSNDI